MPISKISSIKRHRLEEGANVELPKDVVVEILARLPTKSLIRFKCVCKRWFSLIGSDYLATKQFSGARIDHNDHWIDCLLFSSSDDGFVFSLDSLGNFEASNSDRIFFISQQSPWFLLRLIQKIKSPKSPV
ncbi:hypothetical protein Dimus_032519 [Dionaea muscipula]